MINYNSDEYKKLIEEFCSYKGYTENQASFLLRPIVYTKDLFNLIPYQYAKLIIEMCGFDGDEGSRGTKNPQYLRENLSYINQFFEWCKNEKNIIHGNPFHDLDTLSYKNLLFQVIEKMDIAVLYDDTIDMMVDKIELNKSLLEMIMRLFYEGIKNPKELAGIKIDNIDFVHMKIKLEDRVIKCSSKLMMSIKSYMKEKEFYSKKKNSNNVENLAFTSYENYLIKLVVKRESDLEIDNEDNYIRATALRIGRYLKTINLNYIDLNRSGFINAIRREFTTYNDEEFCNIFIGDEKINTGIVRKLKKVMSGYGFEVVYTTINSCIPYVVKSRYYH